MSKQTRNEDYSDNKIASCARTGCLCDSFNGEKGEYCCFTCRRKNACTRRYHVLTAKFASCTRVGCPCTSSYNGKSGKYCCITCQKGKKCEANYHQSPSV